MKNQAPAPLLLASASPRRREILTLLGEDFEVEPALSEPPPDPALPLEKAVLAVARCKAEEVAARHPHRLVVGADTIVVAEGKILGKPGSPEEAGRMLRRLAGRTHEVMTGVWICSPGLCGGFTETASVSFYPMTEEEIAEYVDSGEPMDKAGAYAIQGTGMRYIQGIHGDFYTVMGLPGSRLRRFLRKFREKKGPETP